MELREFGNLLATRITKTQDVLGVKEGGYSSGGDRLFNFKESARLSDVPGETPEQALWGMARKHLVCVTLMVAETAQGKAPTVRYIDEHLGDLINYLILLEALLLERILKGEAVKAVESMAAELVAHASERPGPETPEDFLVDAGVDPMPKTPVDNDLERARAYAEQEQAAGLKKNPCIAQPPVGVFQFEH